MKYRRSVPQNHRDAEHGIAVIWLISFLMVFGVLAAIVIDILRVQAILRQAQNAADAAAVAGARLLDGNVESWGNAKRFAVETLRQQRIGGIGGVDLAELVFNDNAGIEDPLEAMVLQQNPLNLPTPDRYLTNQAVVGPVRFTIERGAYWRDGNGFSFYPLEGVGGTTEQTAARVARPIHYSGVDISEVPVHYDVPVHLMANAVRVRAELTGIRAFFGNFVGISSFGAMARNSTAVSDPVNYPVLPFAVPACALLLDTDSNASSTYQYDTAEFRPSMQCGRETVFTEADPMGPRPRGEALAPYDERATGITRSLSYPYRANERMLPLPGVMGVPESLRPVQGDATDPIAAADFVRILTDAAATGGLRARVGEYLVPLENGVFANGLLTSYSNEAGNALAALIEQGIPFTEAFTDQHGPLPNYPRLRGPRDTNDLVVNIGPNAQLRMQQYPNDRETGLPAFENPLCTDASLRNKSIPERRALPVNIMVVTPTTTRSDGSPDYYCRYDQVFNGQVQDTSPPMGSTRPRIVGFVRAYLFDFRFEKYPGARPCRGDGQSPVCEDPDLPNPAGIIMTGVYTPFLKAAENFVVEHKNWRDCRARAERCRRPNPPPGCPVDCGGSPVPPRAPVDPIWKQVADKGCFDMPNWEDIMECINNPSDANTTPCLANIRRARSEDGFPQRPEIVMHGDACLPMRIPGCTPLDDPRCIRPPLPLKPQYGCGGVRSRLDCGDARLTSPGSAAATRPMIVS